MTKLHIKPAMRYQWSYMWRAALWTAGILIAIMLLVNVIASVIYFSYADIPIRGDIGYAINEAFGSMHVSMIDVGGMLTLMLFIAGICAIREDLRFFIQHGMGRKTTYIANILISLITAAVAGLFSVLLSLISANVGFLHVSLTWFHNENFFISWLLHTLSLFFAWQLGTLISLIYYRLNTLMKVVFSVAAGALFLGVIPGLSISGIFAFGVPILFSTGDGITLTGFLSNPGNLGLVIFVMGALCTIGNFLLIRRATIAPAAE